MVQSIPTDLSVFAQLPIGDPDFDLLRIVAGTNFGMSSPGYGTFRYSTSGDWAVDSFFDITYRVDFIGAPGSPFAGASGSTTSQMRVRTGMPEPASCKVPEIGTGTAEMTPPCPSGWTSEPQAVVSLNGLPPGIPIEGTLRIVPTSPRCRWLRHDRRAGPAAAGRSRRDRAAQLMSGPPYAVSIPHARVRPDPSCPEIRGVVCIQAVVGQIIGDPDFDLLRISAGSDFGLASDGHVTLTHGPGGTWFVDSFFDITYRMDMVGAPGGPLAGHSGSDTETARFTMGDPDRPVCLMPDNGTGTADFPPLCPPGYEGLVYRPAVESGMTPNDPLLGTLHLGQPGPPTVIPGGILGGEVALCTSLLQIDLESVVSGYSRQLFMPCNWEVHSAPRTPGTTPQRFETALFQLDGQLIGDPDFDLLRITGGTGFGMPSPGHTTLTMAGGNWAVDSFFDITYRVDFIGTPGGPFAGMSGSTTLVDRIVAGGARWSGTSIAPARLAVSALAPNPTHSGARVARPPRRHVRAGVHDGPAALADRTSRPRHETGARAGRAARQGSIVRVRTSAGGGPAGGADEEAARNVTIARRRSRGRRRVVRRRRSPPGDWSAGRPYPVDTSAARCPTARRVRKGGRRALTSFGLLSLAAMPPAAWASTDDAERAHCYSPTPSAARARHAIAAHAAENLERATLLVPRTPRTRPLGGCASRATSARGAPLGARGRGATRRAPRQPPARRLVAARGW